MGYLHGSSHPDTDWMLAGKALFLPDLVALADTSTAIDEEASRKNVREQAGENRAWRVSSKQEPTLPLHASARRRQGRTSRMTPPGSDEQPSLVLERQLVPKPARHVLDTVDRDWFAHTGALQLGPNEHVQGGSHHYADAL